MMVCCSVALDFLPFQAAIAKWAMLESGMPLDKGGDVAMGADASNMFDVAYHTLAANTGYVRCFLPVHVVCVLVIGAGHVSVCCCFCEWNTCRNAHCVRLIVAVRMVLFRSRSRLCIAQPSVQMLAWVLVRVQVWVPAGSWVPRRLVSCARPASRCVPTSLGRACEPSASASLECLSTYVMWCAFVSLRRTSHGLASACRDCLVSVRVHRCCPCVGVRVLTVWCDLSFSLFCFLCCFVCWWFVVLFVRFAPDRFSSAASGAR